MSTRLLSSQPLASSNNKRKSNPVRLQACNLCGDEFKTRSKFKRFCTDCREEEVLRFADWLPDSTPSSISEEPMGAFGIALELYTHEEYDYEQREKKISVA